jgi:zinc transporter 7
MGSQFFTAVGAFVGTFLGIWIAETSGTGKGVVLKEGQGLFGSSVAGGDLVIPMTAGGESPYFKKYELMRRIPVYCQCQCYP